VSAVTYQVTDRSVWVRTGSLMEPYRRVNPAPLEADENGHAWVYSGFPEDAPHHCVLCRGPEWQMIERPCPKADLLAEYNAERAEYIEERRCDEPAEGQTAAEESIECPEWCVEDHSGDHPADVLHRSARVSVVPPSLPGHRRMPQMVAHLVAASCGQPPRISVDLDDRMDEYTELDVAGADAFLAELRAYTAKIQALRDRLATMEGR
jgi:hypothetical protein